MNNDILPTTLIRKYLMKSFINKEMLGFGLLIRS